MSIKGIVQFYNEKPWSGNGKSVVFYSIKLEGDKTYYRFGSKKPPTFVKQGASLEFDAKPNDDGKSAEVDVATLKEVAGPPKDAAKPSVGGFTGKDTDSIHYQNARGHAVTYLGLVVANGGVVLPKAKADIMAAMDGLLDVYTAKFYADITTKGAVGRVAGVVEPEAGEPAEPPDEDE
jgi:hypothetical protein